MNRRVLATIGLAVILVLAGCGGSTGGNKGEQLAEESGKNLKGVDVGESYWFEVKLTEKNQNQLVQEQPPFTMENSLERANLIRRYQYLNDRNNVHHVYLMSNDGKVISYFVAQGKVSSVNSKLTNDVQIVRIPGCSWNSGNEGACYKTVESPQMDGSYGTNGNAIFFFTTSGAYVEWNGKYVVSETPLNIQTSVSLTHDVGDSTEDDADSQSTPSAATTNTTANGTVAG